MENKHHQKKYDIHHKLWALAENDVKFKDELTKTCLANFQKLRDQFKDIMTSRDIKALSFISHKYQTVFLTFEFKELADEIEKAKNLLKTEPHDAFQLNQIGNKVEKLCLDILHEFAESDNQQPCC